MVWESYTLELSFSFCCFDHSIIIEKPSLLSRSKISYVRKVVILYYVITAVLTLVWWTQRQMVLVMLKKIYKGISFYDEINMFESLCSRVFWKYLFIIYPEEIIWSNLEDLSETPLMVFNLSKAAGFKGSRYEKSRLHLRRFWAFFLKMIFQNIESLEIDSAILG